LQAGVELEFVLYDASNVTIEVGYYLYRKDKFKFNLNSIEYLIEQFLWTLYGILCILGQVRGIRSKFIVLE
jgi:hypothetical protein